VTVGTQVREALANAKSVQVNFETFALQTKDEVAKERYKEAAAKIQDRIKGLESRMEKIEEEEPSFKMNSEI